MAMRIPSKPFIDGEPSAASQGKTLVLINPADEQPFAEVTAGGVRDVETSVAGAHRAFLGGWRDLAPGKRSDALYQVAALIRKNQAELAQLESRNIGKPIRDALDEIALGARIFEYYAGAISKFYGQTIPVARGGFDFTLRQPMGVVAAIVPWNFPFPIACWKVAPALASGNTVVLKPASQSPLTALRLGDLVCEAGVPPGALQVLPATGAETGDALVTHPLVRKISFTGSTTVGSRIMGLAAKGVKRVSLELGGKSPNVVFADANLAEAAAASPSSVFANTGQDCCARSRVFVERPVFEGFVEQFIAASRKLRIGDPADHATDLGPLVSGGQRDLVENYIGGAAKAGRKIAAGGRRPLSRGFYLEPTVILEPDLSDPVWREEVFGPVVCIRAFDDEARMIDDVNDTPYGLSGSIWTNDLKRALRVARRIESGVLSINSHSSVHVEAPFGGFKQSGLGRDLGMAAMEGFTELKNVYVAD